MMRKVIMGVAAVGAVLALRQVMGRVGRQMRRHCEQMMARVGGPGEAVGGS